VRVPLLRGGRSRILGGPPQPPHRGEPGIPGPPLLPDRPGAISSHFDKPVSMDPDWGLWSKPICGAWSSVPWWRSPCTVTATSPAPSSSQAGIASLHSVQVKLLWALSLQAETHLHRADSGKTLSLYSFLDPLTHLYNPRYFDNQLEKEILRSRRSGGSFSLLRFDIDGFTAYNERFTNSAGDIALQEFAGILSGSVREVDTVARLGGDEFGILLVEGTTEGARALAHRIIERFQRHMLPGRRNPAPSGCRSASAWRRSPPTPLTRPTLRARSIGAPHGQQQGGRPGPLLPRDRRRRGMKKPLPELPVQKIYDAGRSVVDMDKFLEILLFTGMQGLSAGRGSIVVKDPEGDFTLRAAIGFSKHEEHVTATGMFRAGPITNWVVDHQLPLVVAKPEDSLAPDSSRRMATRRNRSFRSR